ncbi:hypothetical protein EJ08DRAFT_165861 [Tothia fuscella]|uniref:Uncharacterized protein n=1 Tax=Tothia fuscella TaxID=1048955 RepID=A0A9P4TZN6_9PEZI|nr:hypothetical protein EJ08DRAFT_165861 [Tothia fuscella]
MALTTSLGIGLAVGLGILFSSLICLGTYWFARRLRPAHAADDISHFKSVGDYDNEIYDSTSSPPPDYWNCLCRLATGGSSLIAYLDTCESHVQEFLETENKIGTHNYSRTSSERPRYVNPHQIEYELNPVIYGSNKFYSISTSSTEKLETTNSHPTDAEPVEEFKFAQPVHTKSSKEHPDMASSSLSRTLQEPSILKSNFANARPGDGFAYSQEHDGSSPGYGQLTREAEGTIAVGSAASPEQTMLPTPPASSPATEKASLIPLHIIDLRAGSHSCPQCDMTFESRIFSIDISKGSICGLFRVTFQVANKNHSASRLISSATSEVDTPASFRQKPFSVM